MAEIVEEKKDTKEEVAVKSEKTASAKNTAVNSGNAEKKAESEKSSSVKAKKTKKKAPYVSKGELKVELVHGIVACTKKQIRTVQALGLKKIGDVKIHKDNPAIAGMLRVVAHLVRAEVVTK